MTLDDMWQTLEDMGMAHETILVATKGWGYSQETMETLLYVSYGYNSFDQLEDEYEAAVPDPIYVEGDVITVYTDRFGDEILD